MWLNPILQGGRVPGTTKHQRRAMRANVRYGYQRNPPAPPTPLQKCIAECIVVGPSGDVDHVSSCVDDCIFDNLDIILPGDFLTQKQIALVKTILKGKRVRGTTPTQRTRTRKAAMSARASCKSDPGLLNCSPGQSPIYIEAWNAYCCARSPVR